MQSSVVAAAREVTFRCASLGIGSRSTANWFPDPLAGWLASDQESWMQPP